MSNITNNEWQERVRRAAAFLAVEAESLYNQKKITELTGMHPSAYQRFKRGSIRI